tara:strand:+ start:8529 stop:9125 length:597 start_codon:yes stop_codon:yes gene_type:complete
VANDDQSRQWILIATIIIIVLGIIFGGYWFWMRDRATAPPDSTEKTTEPTTLPRIANIPPKKPADITPPPSYPPDALLLEQVRKALREGIGPNEALVLAKSLPERSEQADAAFLLLEYAAEYGNAEAALFLGHYYDPTDKGPSGTIRKNPATAYEWYTEALAGGQEEASNQLATLRQWVEKQANQGSVEAEELLNRWP